MDDKLNNDLKKRINEVFDNFEDAHADEGWLLLRKKYPEKAKRRVGTWLWWSSAAAILLLFFGIGLWLNKPKKSEELSNKPIKHNQTETIGLNKNNSQKNQPGDLNTDRVAVVAGNNAPAKGHPKSKPIKSYSDAINIADDSPVKSKNPDQVLAKADVIIKKPDSVNIALNNQPAQQLVVADNRNTDAPNAGTPVKTDKSVSSMFANNNVKNDPKQKEETQKSAKAVRFGVYAATFFNYAKGSDNQINVGAGFTSDIRISKKLKFSTGVAIAQNSLNYGNPIPQAASINTITAAANAIADKPQALLKAAFVPVLNNYNASLVGLDIPMNLKYEFNPQKSDTYISAGLSSGTFINETYTSSFKYSAPFTSSSQQTQDETTHKSFNSFYFAKTLNVSLGVGYPLGKSNRLIIEPFFKYPLDGLGSEHIRFGSGVLNLKLNFSQPKK